MENGRSKLIIPAIIFLIALVFMLPGYGMPADTAGINSNGADSAASDSGRGMGLRKPLLTGNFYTQFRKDFNDIRNKNRASAYFDYGFSPILLWKLLSL